MTDISFISLYVTNIAKSIEFYKGILGAVPVFHRPGFALFALPGGLQLGLWQTATVDPEAEMTGGGAEYAIALTDANTLRTHYGTARTDGLTIVQSPTEMNFGLTYVIEDPDRHRIRYYVPAKA